MTDAAIPIESAHWKRALKWRRNKDTGQQELVGCLSNVILVLTNDTAWRDAFAVDTFNDRLVLRKPLPSVPGLDAPPAGSFVEDGHTAHVCAALGYINELGVGFDLADRGIRAAASQRPFNSLTDHLDALQWDGQRRVDSWLSDYLGVTATPYTSSVGRWWLISLMARAYEPGCKADHMLVLEGKQGRGKSSALEILASKQFFTPKLPPMRDYDRAAHALRGAWLVEIGELDAFRGAAATQIKDFLSMRHDHYHAPYGRHHVDRDRTCVFAGTTNPDTYLNDPTGARRFWPVKVTDRLDLAALRRDRDALMAEARELYRGGCQWWPDDSIAAELEEAQEARQQGDEWEAVVGDYLDAEPYRAKEGVTTRELLEHALKMGERDWTTDAQKRVGTCLRRAGWDPRQVRAGGRRERRYWPKGTA